MTLNFLVAITLICWSLWGIFDKKALTRTAPVTTLLLTYVFYLPALALAVLAANYALPGWHLSTAVIFWTGLAALANWLGLIAYLKAMSMAEASYVLGITSGYPVVMQVIAFFVLGEKIVPLRVVGSILIFLGVFVIGLDPRSKEKRDKRAEINQSIEPAEGKDRASLAQPEAAPLNRAPGNDRWLLYMLMLVATLGWGSMGIFDKLAVQSAQALEAFIGLLIWNCLFALLSWLIACKLQAVPPRFQFDQWQYPGLSSLCLIAGGFAYIAALTMSTATYVIVITGCYPLLMYVFAVLLLGEKVNRLRLAGIAALVSGGLLTQLTQSI